MATSRFLIPILVLTCLVFTTGAKEILVGGKKNSWSNPPSSDFFNHWAEKTRFKTGDYLTFTYNGKTDSVLQVTKQDYKSCNTSKPMKEHKGGHTKIQLKKSGPIYFISGADGRCQKGEKLLVVVLSHKSGHSHSPAAAPVATVLAPAPSPTTKSAGHGLKTKGVLGVISLVGLGFTLF